MPGEHKHPFGILSAVASLIAIAGFFGFKGWADQPAPPASAGAAPAPAATTEAAVPNHSPTVRSTATSTATTVACAIEDRLGADQASETVLIRFGSRTWVLEVDEDDSANSVTLRFPRPGSYTYAVAVKGEMVDGTGYTGTGKGSLVCTGGQKFGLAAADTSTEPWVVTIEEL